MQTKILKLNDMNDAVKAIQAGQLIAFPTETVYGLGADALNEDAVKAVYAAKGRPSDNPLIVHVSSESELIPFVKEISADAQKLMDTFWPGPLTLIFKLKDENSLPKAVTGGLETAAFRMPDKEVTRDLIKQSGRVLVGPSANSSGKPSPTQASHVLDDLFGKIYGVIDDGPCRVGVESTVIDVSAVTALPTILRPGVITKEQIETEIGPVLIDKHLIDQQEVPKSPGMKYKHYSPDTPVIMIDTLSEKVWLDCVEKLSQHNKAIGILAHGDLVNKLYSSADVATFKLSVDEKSVSEAAKNLFAGLRYLDRLKPNLDVILAEVYPEVDEGTAYMNRLNKAAGGKVYSTKEIENL
ncbi:L-threonylcarbamoyladenylate synthase [Vagococcus vulneris]|uniref:Threonylcarbamoyl-AMP synthase n=1 Tax=Vagococcus vulneris TaxID=1977869 RepID=A0A429ZWQ4_9ENTE|nr:L-threonylcarbamoyladenylate synthase [Vagococcus vulneris]RST98214.1 threonylcarbamoyl-AMP synthase [Vagococcus vulneris]